MKTCLKVVSGIMVASFLVTATDFRKYNVISAEDEVSSVNNQISELEQQQKNLNSELANLKNNLNDKRAYRSSLLEQLGSLQSQISLLEQKIDLINREVLEKEAQISTIKQSMDVNMATLRERLKAIYKAGDVPELAIFLNVKDFDDLLDKANIIQKLSKYDAELIDGLKTSISKIKEEEEIIEKNKSEIESSKLSLDNKRNELQNLQQENDRVIRELQSQESNLKAKINSNEARKRSLQDKISRQGTGRIGDYKKGRYIWPVPGHGRISSGWGDGRRHNGIDIPAPKGTKVVAAADGVVVGINASNRWGSGWGYYVKISHGGGYETMYAHLSKITVSQGQQVRAGEIVGEIGSTGRSTGNHLHFGTSKNGKWYNPKTEV